MKTINRMMTNVCSDNLVASKEFYTKLFKLNVAFDSDWFVHLTSSNGQLELGIIARTSEVVPVEYQNIPQGFYITFVVDSADDVFETAVKENFQVVEKPTNTTYGQRRLLLRDPAGALIDVSSLIPD